MVKTIAPPPVELQTLNQILEYRVRTEGDFPILSLLHRVKVQKRFTYRELYTLSQHFAAALQARGVERGDRIFIILPTSEDFFATLWGTLLAGATAVPIYPPIRLHRMHDYQGYLLSILKNCDPRLIVTDRMIAPLLGFLKREPGIPPLVRAEDLKESDEPYIPVTVEPDDTALIQYTSGSTATPKGVQLYHRHLIANLLAIGQHTEIHEDERAVCWLPLYHDMGLIGFVLGTLYWRIPVYIFSPLEFIRRPAFWLKALSEYRATVSAGPNFAYSFCANRVRDIELEGLDLSSWRIAMCGAEPIQAHTIQAFLERFQRYGLRPEAFVPAYGLAENSLAVALGKPGEGLKIDWVHRETFETERVAVPAPPDPAVAIPWVACGIPIPGVKIRIVDETGQDRPARHEGEIWVQSPSMTVGYFRNPEATAKTFHDGWLATGDLGYMADGYLYVTGRKKEIIIRGGRNYYPQDIERVINEIDGIRKGDVIAFGVPDEQQGTERIVVVAETKVREPERWQAMQHKIRQAVLREVGVPVGEILLAPPGTIPKTSSGKLQRVRLRQAYLAGEIRPLRREDLRRWPRLRWWTTVRQYLRTRIGNRRG